MLRADPATLLVGLLVFALPFQRVWTLPIVGHRLQPPEVAGLAVIAFAAWALGRVRRIPTVSTIDWGVAAWWGGVTLALVAYLVRDSGPARIPLVEWVGVTYLAVLYGALRVLLTPQRLRALPAMVVVSALVAAAFGLLGVVLSIIGIETRLALQTAQPFPYLGISTRATAFTPAPAMLASVVSLGFFALAVSGWSRVVTAGAVALMGVALLATTSKAAVCLVVGGLVAWACRHPDGARLARVGAAAACVGLGVVFVSATHVFVTTSPHTAARSYPLVEREPIGSVTLGGTTLTGYLTNYSVNRRTNIAAVRETWPWGVGPGRHGAFVREQMAAGYRDRAISWADPHSTYLGVPAELGLAGVVGFGGFVAALIVALRRASEMRSQTLVFACVVGGLASITLDATATDVMNFRHLWVALAAVACWTTPTGRASVTSQAGDTGSPQRNDVQFRVDRR